MLYESKEKRHDCLQVLRLQKQMGKDKEKESHVISGEKYFEAVWNKIDYMRIAVMKFRLRAAWVHSLKEKRMIVKSLIVKIQNKYHVSAAEVDEQDTHQIIVIGVAAIVPHNAMADSLMDDISLFVEENTEAEIINEEREIR